MVTVNRKSTTDTHTNKVSHEIRRQENKRGREEKKTYKNKSKTTNKMAIRTYISIITLNLNRYEQTNHKY